MSKTELTHMGKTVATGTRMACEYALQRLSKQPVEDALASGDWEIVPATTKGTIIITKPSKMNNQQHRTGGPE